MLKFLIALVMLCGLSYADVPTKDFVHTYNELPGLPATVKYQFGTKLGEAHETAVCVYDFATLGGATGTLGLISSDLKTPCRLPGKAVVRNAQIEVETSLAGTGSPTVALGTNTTTYNDLMTATAIATLVAGYERLLVPVFATYTTWIKVPTGDYIQASTAAPVTFPTSGYGLVTGQYVNAIQPVATIAAGTLTAGHFRVFLDYVRGE